jgi:hypothetical protein
MKIRKLKWRLPLIILLMSLYPGSPVVASSNDSTQLETIAEQESFKYNRINDKNDALFVWHPHYQERCYFTDRKNITNKNIK